MDWFKTGLNTERTLIFHKNKSRKFLHSPRNYKLTKLDPSSMGTGWEEKPRHLPINIEKRKQYTKSNINTKNLKHLEILFFCPEYFRTNQYKYSNNLTINLQPNFVAVPPWHPMPPLHSLIIWHKYWDYIIILYCYHFLTELVTEHVLLHIQTIICILIN